MFIDMGKIHTINETILCNHVLKAKYLKAQKILFSNLKFLGRYRKHDESIENINIGIAYSKLFATAFAILCNMFSIRKAFIILKNIANLKEFEQELDKVKWELSGDAHEDLFENMAIFQPILANFIKIYYIKEIEEAGYTEECLSVLYETNMQKIKQIHRCEELKVSIIEF